MQSNLFLCQVRIADEWLTDSSGSERVVEAWRRQVAPRKRRQGYDTRVVCADA